MKAHLVPCPACQRHVRLGSPSCPFCSANTAELDDATPEVGSARLSSLAVMTFRATALGVALAACGGETGPKPPPAATGGSSAHGGSDSGVSGSGGVDGSGGSTISVGGTTDAGGFGGSIPIYRATPRG